MKFMGCIGVLLFPVAIGGLFVTVGVLTKFRPEQSTFPQRIWLLIWIPVNLVGCLFGLVWQVGVFASVFNDRAVSVELNPYDVEWAEGCGRWLMIAMMLTPFMILAFWVFFEAGKLIMVSETCKFL